MAKPKNQKPPFALRALAAFAVTLAALFVLLLAAYALPGEPVRDHVYDSAVKIAGEGLYPEYLNFKLFQMDNYTDTIMLTEAASADEAPPLTAMMTNTAYNVDNFETLADDLQWYIERDWATGAQRTDAPALVPFSYARYWHGYLIWLRPLLLVTDITGVRVVQYLVLAALFAADIPKVSHNVKDLMRTLLDAGLPAEGFVFDTALAAYLLDATAGKYDLPRLFVAYFNQELPKPAHLEPDAFSPLGDQAAAWASLHSYGAAIEALHGVLLPRLREQGMEKLYFDVELPLCRVLADMERSGFLVDGGALARFGRELSDTIDRLEQRIYAAAGQQFNINSPKQLGKVLFEDLGLPHGKKTKTGWSTNADVLEKLKDHPLVADVLTYRQYAKLKSTYADGLLKVIDPDGRIRTSFQMTVTATGRLSSTEPNLQNIPTRTELGSKMREMFVAAPGHVLVDADYSQIELRLLAHISGDTAMQQAFLSGADFHTVTAARVFHVPQDQVTHQMRSRAKAVNFGIVYGISAFSLSQDIGVTVQEAKEYMDRYFATYTGVKQYMTDVVDKAREQGYVETLWHRRRALPELKSSNFNMRSFGERVALNMPIQGTAADIIKLAMVRVHSRLAREGLAARLIMQVHDELIVECPEAEASRVEALLQQEMQGVAELSVPLLAEAHSGRNWLAAKG